MSSGTPEDFPHLSEILSPIPPMPTISLRVRPHGQRRISGESTLWRMGSCFAWGIIGITSVFAFQFILRSGSLSLLMRSLTFFWADPRNIFFLSNHYYTPWCRSESPMGLSKCSLPSSASRFPPDSLHHIHCNGYEGKWWGLWTGWRWRWLWRALRTRVSSTRASENLAWWFVVRRGDSVVIWLYGRKQKQCRDVGWYAGSCRRLNGTFHFCMYIKFILAMSPVSSDARLSETGVVCDFELYKHHATRVC